MATCPKVCEFNSAAGRTFSRGESTRGESSDCGSRERAALGMPCIYSTSHGQVERARKSYNVPLSSESFKKIGQMCCVTKLTVKTPKRRGRRTMCSLPSASARPAAAPAPPSAAASGASFSSFHSRQQQEDAALLTLNTLLHAMVGTTLAIDCKDDRTVRGCLKKADNYMKCVAVGQTALSPNQTSTPISSIHILDPRLTRC